MARLSVARSGGNEVTVFRNTYEDDAYANSYASLEWGGTYFLVYRDLPAILRTHIIGTRALDFGCGTGRSTRLLRSLGYRATGVDISSSMVRRARQLDPEGDYILLAENRAGLPSDAVFDLILAAFPFDNTPAPEKTNCFRLLRKLLASDGKLVNIVSSPHIYTYEWVSFTTLPFPENRMAHDGDIVRIITREFAGGTPAEDVLCSDAAYREIYGQCGLEVIADYRPLGASDDGIAWITETQVAPWVIYVLGATR